MFLIRAVCGGDRSGLLLVEALLLIVHGECTQQLMAMGHCREGGSYAEFWNWIANLHLLIVVWQCASRMALITQL